MAVFLRIFIGLVFLISGFEKLISPYQNFLYVIQAYEIFPSGMEKAVAFIVPWIELLTGLFLILGLWLGWSLKGALVLFSCFIVIVGQALIRSLPLEACGCFGEWIHILPKNIIVFDSVMLLGTFWLLRHPAQVKRFSLDQSLKA